MVTVLVIRSSLDFINLAGFMRKKKKLQRHQRRRWVFWCSLLLRGRSRSYLTKYTTWGAIALPTTLPDLLSTHCCLNNVMYTVRPEQPRANGKCSIELLLYAPGDTTIACCCCFFVVTDGG
jgi:hypothetical protein